MLKTILFRNVRSFPKIIKSNLYSPASMGIDSYLTIRSKVHEQFGENSTKFKNQLVDHVDNKPNNMIFTEDLKNMVHLADYKEDINVVVKMIKKFNAQNAEVRLGNFIFGPVVMRMLYCAKNVDIALQCFKDSELEKFFDQTISCQIILDMLYENKRYADMLDVYNLIKTRQISGLQYSKHVIVLVYAALYKLNTLESLQEGMKLWHDLNSIGNIPMRKSVTFLAGLALNQNSPQISIEVLSLTRDHQYLTVRNIKAQAFADLGRINDALIILKNVLQNDSYSNKKQTFLTETVLKIKNSIEINEQKEHEAEFQRIERTLIDNEYLTNMTLDEILCSEIVTTSNVFPKQNRSFIASSFSKKRDQSQRYNNRPGLHELQ